MIANRKQRGGFGLPNVFSRGMRTLSPSRNERELFEPSAGDAHDSHHDSKLGELS